MTEGLIEGLTGALGDELTRLGGLRSTRVRVQVEAPVTRLAYGADNATANVAGTIVTVTSPLLRPFPASITAAHWFRSLSPLQYEPTLADNIVSRDSATQLTLGGGKFTKLVSSSWEVYDDTQIAILEVETTHDWEDEGYFVLDGGLYRYGAKTPGSLEGIEYHNGEVWTYQLPLGTIYEIGDEVVDYTQIYSAVDTMRRGFLLPYATGTDLETIGRNLSVPRPTTANDDLYRSLIQALAYTPRGTMWVIELVLDAVLGEGNYNVFEDLTQIAPASTPANQAFSYKANNQSIVYIEGDRDKTNPAGKTYLEATEYAPLTAATTLDIDPASTPTTMVGVRLARECFERLVAFGTDAYATVAYNGATVIQFDVTVTGPLGTDIPLRGDELYIDLGRGYFRVGAVTQRTGPTTFEVGTPDEAPAISYNAAFGTAGAGVSWKLLRASTGCKFGYIPSKDVQIEYTGHAGRQMWTYDGRMTGDPVVDPAAEATWVAALAMTQEDGLCTQIEEDVTAAEFQAYYRQDARVVPESDATFSAVMRLENTDTNSTMRGQFSQRIYDGNRLMAVGVQRELTLAPPSDHNLIGFYNPYDGALPWLGTAKILGDAGTINWHTVEIVKCTEPNAWTTNDASVTVADSPHGYVQLRVDGVVIEEHPYTDFPLIPGGGSTYTNGKSVEFVAASSQFLYDAAGNAGAISTPNGLFTFSIWFKTTATPALAQVIAALVAEQSPPATLSDFTLSMDAVGDVSASMRNAASVQVGAATSLGAYNDDVWHLAVMTWDGANLTLFVDPGDPGGQTATGIIGTRKGSTALPQNASLYLGQTLGSYHFDGYLDEAAYWNAPFVISTATELFDGRRAMNLLTHSQAGDLESWWRLGDYNLDSTDSANPAARIYDVGPVGYNINLTPDAMVPGNISTSIYVPPGTGTNFNKREIGIFDAPNTVGKPVHVRIRDLNWSAYTPKDYYNHHVAQGKGSFTAPSTLDDSDALAFGASSAGDYVRITGVSNLGTPLLPAGNMLGEWEVEVPAAGTATITGRTQKNGNIDPHAKDVFYVRGERVGAQTPVAPPVFRYPDALGRRVYFITGENAGQSRKILKLLDPVTGADLALTGDFGRQARTWTNTVQLEAVLASKTTDAQWQLLPTSLASDGNIQFEVTAQGSLALPTVTLPQTFVIPLYSTGDGPLMEAHYTELLSAQVIDEDAINTTNASPGYAYYPFYLADEFGWLREILEDVITVAGVHVNLSDLYYDDAGPHIL